MDVVSHFGLKHTLFRSDDRAVLFTSRAFKAAWIELVEAIAACESPLVLTGAAGVGKTALLGELTRRLAADGVQIASFASPELVNPAHLMRSTVVVIDDADACTGSRLDDLVEAARKHGTTVVLAALGTLRMANSTRAIRLRPMDGTEVYNLLLDAAEEAGRPDLFSPAAQGAIVDAACGLPRYLKYITNSALMEAMFEGGTIVESRHIGAAIATRMTKLPDAGEAYEPSEMDELAKPMEAISLLGAAQPILLREPHEVIEEYALEEIFVPLPPKADELQHVARDARGMIVGVAALGLLIAAVAGYAVSVFGIERIARSVQSLFESLM